MHIAGEGVPFIGRGITGEEMVSGHVVECIDSHRRCYRVTASLSSLSVDFFCYIVYAELAPYVSFFYE